MEPLKVKKSEKNIMALTSSPLWKFYDFVLLLTSILFLNFQIERHVGNNALFASKFAFLIEYVSNHLKGGRWLQSLFYLLPVFLIISSVIQLLYTKHLELNGISNQILIRKNFCLISLGTKQIPFETLRQILIQRENSGKTNYLLLLEESSGRKILLQKSPYGGRIKTLAKKVQELIHLPVNQLQA